MVVAKQVVTRNEAVKKGLKRYFTGRVCQNGHLSERYTNGGACISCLRPLSERTDLDGKSVGRIRPDLVPMVQAATVDQFDALYRYLRRCAVVYWVEHYPDLRGQLEAEQAHLDGVQVVGGRS